MKKDILYLVVVPNNPSLLPAVRKYFRDLSIVFRTCHLGQHLAIEKDPIGEGGVVVCPPLGTTDDPLTNSRHGGWSQDVHNPDVMCLTSLPQAGQRVSQSWSQCVPKY